MQEKYYKILTCFSAIQKDSMYVWQCKQRNFFKIAGKTKLEWHKQGNPLLTPGGCIFMMKK